MGFEGGERNAWQANAELSRLALADLTATNINLEGTLPRGHLAGKLQELTRWNTMITIIEVSENTDTDLGSLLG